MKGVFLFTACTRGRPQALLFGAVGCLLLLLLQVAPPALAQPYRDGLSKTADLPQWRIRQWQVVYKPNLFSFGWFPAALGDINDDGFDDFAISSGTDTTYIFLGGTEFSHEPAYLIRGGSAGVATADLNGDGLLDIVTAVGYFDTDGEKPYQDRGAIRIYLRKEGDVKFTWEEDTLIAGEPGENLGWGVEIWRSSVATLDYNGDGHPDLLTRAYDLRDTVTYKLVLFLGGNGFTLTRGPEFLTNPTPPWRSTEFVVDFYVGDINGDARGDVFVYDRRPGNKVRWHVYLGNAEGRVDSADYVLIADQDWAPQRASSNIMDIDGDGYDDVIDAGHESIHRQFGDALLFRGKVTLPSHWMPDDPNLNPHDMGEISPQWAGPVGDMDGDGRADLVMAWNDYWGGQAYFFYPGGSSFRSPTGYFGTLIDVSHVVVGTFNVGDVNGDGYEDLLTRGGGSGHDFNNRFEIWLGSGRLKTGVALPDNPQPMGIEVSPHPLSAGGHMQLTLRGLHPGPASIEMHDLLGREVLVENIDDASDRMTLSINLPKLPAGSYLLTLTQKGHTCTRPVILY